MTFWKASLIQTDCNKVIHCEIGELTTNSKAKHISAKNLLKRNFTFYPSVEEISRHCRASKRLANPNAEAKKI